MKISKLLVVSALVCFTTNALYSMEDSFRIKNELSGTPNTNTTITQRYKINSAAKLSNDNHDVDQMFENIAKSFRNMPQLQNQMNTLEMNNNTINTKNMRNPFMPGNIEDNPRQNYNNQREFGMNNSINNKQNSHSEDNMLQQTAIVQINDIMQKKQNNLFQSVNKLSRIKASLSKSISSHNNAMIKVPEAALATLLMHLAQARKTCDDIDENVKRIFNNPDYLNLDTYYKYAKLDDGGSYDDPDIYKFITNYLMQQQVSNSNMESESDYKKVVQFMLALFSYQNFRQVYYSVVNNIRDLITKSISQFKSKSKLYNETPLMKELLAYINTDKHNLLDNYKTLRELVIKNNYNLDLSADLIQQWYNSPIPREQQQYLIPIEVLSALKNLSAASFDTTLLKLSQPLSVEGIRAISDIEGVIGLMQHISYNLRTAMSNHIIAKQNDITVSNIFDLDQVKNMFPHQMQRNAVVLGDELESGSMQASFLKINDNNTENTVRFNNNNIPETDTIIRERVATKVSKGNESTRSNK